MMYQTLFLLLAAGQLFEFENPKPVAPASMRAEGNGFAYDGNGWHLKMTPMKLDAFQRYMLNVGVQQTVLNKPGVQKTLERVAPFLVEIANTGIDQLTFNPDQILIRSSRGPDGYIIDMASYWPAELPRRTEEQEQFARVFKRGTVELKPGESHQQLIVFHPYSEKFRKKVNIQMSRIYYGIESFELECQFQVRYPKK